MAYWVFIEQIRQNILEICRVNFLGENCHLVTVIEIKGIQNDKVLVTKIFSCYFIYLFTGTQDRTEGLAHD